jgi:hypothetical protein
MYGDALVDTFYNSFSSAGPESPPTSSRWKKQRPSDPWNQQRSAAFFDEVELLKITATKSDLERFNRNVLKIKNKWDLDISASLVVPKSEALKQRLEKQRMEQDKDMLDYVFPDKIPILHDLLMAGEVETQYLRIEGSHDMVNAFNRLAEQMMYDKNMKHVAIVVAERRKIFVDNVMGGGDRGNNQSSFFALNDLDAILDSIYSADFSKTMPWLHKALTA